MLLFFSTEIPIQHVRPQDVPPDSHLPVLENICRRFDSSIIASVAAIGARSGKSGSAAAKLKQR